MAEEVKHEHTHKEQRRQYTYNKLKGFGEEILISGWLGWRQSWGQLEERL